MTEPVPNPHAADGIAYGHVFASYTEGTADTSLDLDPYPDERWLSGSVTFRPKFAGQQATATLRVPGTPRARGLVVTELTYDVVNSRLVDRQDREGVWLTIQVGDIPVHWQATVALKNAAGKVVLTTAYVLTPEAWNAELDGSRVVNLPDLIPNPALITPSELAAILSAQSAMERSLAVAADLEEASPDIAAAADRAAAAQLAAQAAAEQVPLAKGHADRAEGLAVAQDEHVAGVLEDPQSATHAALLTVGNATYVPAGLAASKRSKLSQIAVPRDSTGATGNAARLQLTGHAPSASPRGIGTDGAMYMIRLENTMWRTYDGMSTWEQGATFTPYTVATYSGGGTFTLTAGGQTTAALSFGSTAAQVQAALEALSSVGPGNVTVWADPQMTAPRRGYTILFRGSASTHVLTGASSLTASPAPQFVIQREKMLYVNRTSSGYVIVMLASQNPVLPAGHTTVWHTTDFTTAADLQLVLTCNGTTLTGFAVPRHVNGDTWLLFGEYRTAQYPSIPNKRFLSTNGGLTWTLVRTQTPSDTSVNCHAHTGLIESTGRIWVSDGDQVNAWYGYSDDKGKTWVPVRTPADSEAADPGGVFQQPTTMIDFTTDDRIAVSPDRGAFKPGMWDTDASTRETTRNFGLPGLYELTPGNGNDAAAQYGHPMYAQDGRTAYVMFSDTGSGSKTTHIAATGDWGRTWWLVASIPWGATGSLGAGIYGPDLNGRLFMQGTNLPTYSSGVISAPVLKWDWQMLPSAE